MTYPEYLQQYQNSLLGGLFQQSAASSGTWISTATTATTGGLMGMGALAQQQYREPAAPPKPKPKTFREKLQAEIDEWLPRMAA
jgi:hypothetical protein